MQLIGLLINFISRLIELISVFLIFYLKNERSRVNKAQKGTTEETGTAEVIARR